MKIVLVDDEPLAIQSTQAMIERNFPQDEVVGVAYNIRQAKALIDETQPDLVLCDIEMPNGSGFDLLDQFSQIPFALVFITAYDQYAIRAFKYSAQNYLLKPFTQEQFRQVLEQARKHSHEQAYLEELTALKENLKEPKCLVVKGEDGPTTIVLSNLVRLKANGNYTELYCQQQGKVLSSISLKYYADLLDDQQFFRLHHSHVVNRNFVKSVDSHKQEIELTTGLNLPISQRKYYAFIQWLKEA